jgi:hypothetical protein
MSEQAGKWDRALSERAMPPFPLLFWNEASRTASFQNVRLATPNALFATPRLAVRASAR